MYSCDMYCLRSLRRVYWSFDACEGRDDSRSPRTPDGLPKLSWFQCAQLPDLYR
uniref:Uncharacterized protein n=1 Tax=Arundo donax TaxID=35708 RepID=A0A0A9DND4_ARUDO